MSQKCYRCEKPVYFAERRTSLGKDWHRECLCCESCSKVLNPGQHAEHKGLPYCHIPCYSRLFGPTLVGRGNVSHIQKQDITGGSKQLVTKLQEYNQFYKETAPSRVLNINQEDGIKFIEGLLRICWGVKKPIQLQQMDNVPVFQKKWRKSYYDALDNGEGNNLDTVPESASVTVDSRKLRRNSLGEPEMPNKSAVAPVVRRRQKFNTVAAGRNKLRKRYSINGHLYDSGTCVFTPNFGSVMTVTVSSRLPVPDIVHVIIDKFKVLNSPSEFGLFIVRNNGSVEKLDDTDLPLIERVVHGPEEQSCVKIYLMEKDADKNIISEIPPEIADFVNLPDPMLQAFLEKYTREEEEAMKKIKKKYEIFRQQLSHRMEELEDTRQK